MRLPLAMLLLNTAPQEFARRTQSIELIEKTQVLGTPSFHLAGRTATVDYQIWISDSDKPLPLRLVLTYRQSPGQPQFRAQFLDWNINPQIDRYDVRHHSAGGRTKDCLSRTGAA